MKEKLKAAVYGFAVGDALGVPFEFKTRDTFKCTNMTGGGSHNQPVGTWSDDTSMILATMESLSNFNGNLCVEDLMREFTLWADEGKFTPWGNCFDIGITTSRAIRKAKHIPDYESWGETSEHSNGNGSLMRILPFAFLPYVEPVIDIASMITHNTSRCKFACKIYVKLCQDLIADTFDPFNPYINAIREMNRDSIKSTGYVLDSLVAAIWCFLSSDNYAQAVITAVNLGDDTDTIAALTGGIAGLFYGLEDIPKEWINKLVAKDILDTQIEKFGKIISA